MKKWIPTFGLLFALAFVSGCGQAQPDMPSEASVAVEDAQWRAEGLAPWGEQMVEQAYWVGQYLPWEHRDQAAGTEMDWEDSGVCGELFWRLGTEVRADEETVIWNSGREYIMEIYDTVSGETAAKRFTPGDLGLENAICMLDSVYILDSGHYVFRGQGYELDEEGVCRQTVDRIIYTDLAGDVQTVDFWDIYLEKGIEEERVYTSGEFKGFPVRQPINWCCDGKGNICAVEHKTERGSELFCLFDRNGELLMEYEGTRGQQFVNPLRTRDGELILPVYDQDESCYEFLWADASGGEMRSLGSMESKNPDILKMCGLLGDDIYYISVRGIVKWNIKSGSRVQVFDFKEAGMSTQYQVTLALRPGQTPVLRLRKGGMDWLAVLEDHEVSAGEAIWVANLTQGSGAALATCVTYASLVDPNIRYQYEEGEASRDRIMAELSAGKGPDLLYVSREDMYVLAEKGLLLDLEELIPGELREEILPGALGLGTVSGKLKGVPVSVEAATLVAAQDTWPGDAWRLEDVIGLMEEGKLTGAIYSPSYQGSYLGPAVTVWSLVEYSLEDSYLIDWENRKSHFDDERFIRLLEITRTNLISAPKTETWLDGGKHVGVGYLSHQSYFNEFFTLLEEENGRCIGYPTEGVCGNYLETPGVLVVNANITKKEAAANFLKTLLGEEMQSEVSSAGLSVRKLKPEDRVYRNESGTLFYNGSELTVFSDGTTSLQRAAAFLESCVAAPRTYPRLWAIFYEELDAMQTQNLSPQQAAENLNRHIQLYLDEGTLY